MTENLALFDAYSVYRDSRSIRITNMSCSSVVGIGSVTLTQDICLKSVLFVQILLATYYMSVNSFPPPNATLNLLLTLASFKIWLRGRQLTVLVFVLVCLYLFRMYNFPKTGPPSVSASLFSTSCSVFHSNKDSDLLLWHYHTLCIYRSYFLVFSVIKLPNFYSVTFVNSLNTHATRSPYKHTNLHPLLPNSQCYLGPSKI